MRSTPLSFHYANPLLEKLGPEFFKIIPQSPGVYFMHHEDGRILYIGKAKDLRARLSHYKGIKPGTAPEHTLELIENVARLRWEEHESEQAAILREAELIRAVRPAFNIAGNYEVEYLYIGLRIEQPIQPGSSARVHFQLTSNRELARDYRLFGCFKHRRRTKTGYTALLRLLYAATMEKPRFSFPARITRSSPPYLYTTELPSELIDPLERFLAGRDMKLLREILDRMLANESLPRFMHPSLQDDLNVVQEFYRLGPKATYLLKRRHGLRVRVVSHRKMDQLIRLSCEEDLPEASSSRRNTG